MKNNIRAVLLSELHTATCYLDRLFQAVAVVAGQGHHPKFKEICHSLYFDISGHIETLILQDKFIAKESGVVTQATSEELRGKIHSANNLLETIIKLDFDQKTVMENTVNYINILYTHAHHLHLFVFGATNIVAEYPRMNLIEPKGENAVASTDGTSITAFHLPLDKILEVTQGDLPFVNSIEWQRDKKHERLLQEGHRAIYVKQYAQAMDYFSKAHALKETAEVLNLLGWTNFLTGKLPLAKEFCLKAIQKDPDYGPPYNDLGSYMIAEGQYAESLKWFALAKNAPLYQNREFAYINAGRAYVAMKDFERALKEFDMAQTLSPANQEIKETITKLKATLERQERKNSASLFET